MRIQANRPSWFVAPRRVMGCEVCLPDCRAGVTAAPGSYMAQGQWYVQGCRPASVIGVTGKTRREYGECRCAAATLTCML